MDLDTYLTPIGLSPGTGGWSTGEWRSLDGTPPRVIMEADIREVIGAGQTPEDWDGSFAAVVLLHDGTYAAWEGWWGPTGHSFSEDAYGGDGVVYFASSLEIIREKALTAEGRRLCGLSYPHE